MQIPLQLQFKNVEKTDQLEEYVNRRTEKLEHFCDHISSCRVIVDEPQKHIDSGSSYRVRIDVTVPPGHELVSKREPGEGRMDEDLKSVISDAFSGMERQLKKLNRKQHGDVKKHPEQQVSGIVEKLFPEEDYGIIRSVEGRDIYFHRNSVLNNDYDRLEVGTGVAFFEEMGEKGLQASTVRIAAKPGVRSPKTRNE